MHVNPLSISTFVLEVIVDYVLSSHFSIFTGSNCGSSPILQQHRIGGRGMEGESCQNSTTRIIFPTVLGPRGGAFLRVERRTIFSNSLEEARFLSLTLIHSRINLYALGQHEENSY